MLDSPRHTLKALFDDLPYIETFPLIEGPDAWLHKTLCELERAGKVRRLEDEGHRICWEKVE